MKSGIYEIVNNANGKRYIGSTHDFAKRWSAHRKALSGGRHCNPAMQASWNKRGADAFSFRRLVICKPNNLLLYEQRCIDGLHPEYNICVVAGSTLGTKQSSELRARRSQAMRGEKHPLWGTKASAETRAKLSASHMGIRLSTDHRAKIASGHIGLKRSLEDRAKMSAAQSKRSPETCAKLSAALTGRRLSEEHRMKLVGNKNCLGKKNALGYKHTPETRKKMSAAHMGKKHAAK